MLGGLADEGICQDLPWLCNHRQGGRSNTAYMLFSATPKAPCQNGAPNVALAVCMMIIIVRNPRVSLFRNPTQIIILVQTVILTPLGQGAPLGLGITIYYQSWPPPVLGGFGDGT